MPNRAMITFSPPKFECDDFLVLALLDNLADDRRTVDEWAAVRQLLAVAMKEYFGKSCLRAGLQIETIDIDRVAFRHAILFAAGFDDRKSHERLRKKPRKISRLHAFDK